MLAQKKYQDATQVEIGLPDGSSGYLTIPKKSAQVKTSPGTTPTLPRNIQLNNPGNIRRNMMTWKVLTAKDHMDQTLASFDSMEEGVRAIGRIFNEYQNERGRNTFKDLLICWASNSNITTGHVLDIIKSMNVGRNDKITIGSNNETMRLIKAVIIQESGPGYVTDAQIYRGLGLTLPTHDGGDAKNSQASIPDQKNPQPPNKTGVTPPKNAKIAQNKVNQKGPASSATKLSLGLQSNNPGNILCSMAGSSQPGTSITVFESVEEGISAIGLLLNEYQHDFNITGLNDILVRWTSDNSMPSWTLDSNTSCWSPDSTINGRAQDIVMIMGVNGNTQIKIGNNDETRDLIKAIITHENGSGCVTDAQLFHGMLLAFPQWEGNRDTVTALADAGMALQRTDNRNIAKSSHPSLTTIQKELGLSSSTLLHGMHLNNPGNIRRGKMICHGLTKEQLDKHLVTFKTMEHGISTIGRALRDYQNMHRIDTIDGMLQRWALNNNNTTGDSHSVIEKMGVKYGTPIVIGDNSDTHNLIKAIVTQENGHGCVTDDQIHRGLALAFPKTDPGQNWLKVLADIVKMPFQQAKNGPSDQKEVSTIPRGIELNNPGNLRHDIMSYKGLAEDQMDKTFVTFKSMAYGVCAMSRILHRYQNKDHFNTVGQLLNRWASNYNNLTEHVPDVLECMGAQQNTPITIGDNHETYQLVKAIIAQETGPEYVSDIEIYLGLIDAFAESHKDDEIVKASRTVTGLLSMMEPAKAAQIIHHTSEIAN